MPELHKTCTPALLFLHYQQPMTTKFAVPKNTVANQSDSLFRKKIFKVLFVTYTSNTLQFNIRCFCSRYFKLSYNSQEKGSLSAYNLTHRDAILSRLTVFLLRPHGIPAVPICILKKKESVDSNHLIDNQRFAVGVPRFELGTPCSQSRCANRTALHPENNYPILRLNCKCKSFSCRGTKSRTWDPLLPKQVR